MNYFSFQKRSLCDISFLTITPFKLQIFFLLFFCSDVQDISHSIVWYVVSPVLNDVCSCLWKELQNRFWRWYLCLLLFIEPGGSCIQLFPCFQNLLSVHLKCLASWEKDGWGKENAKGAQKKVVRGVRERTASASRMASGKRQVNSIR